MKLTLAPFISRAIAVAVLAATVARAATLPSPAAPAAPLVSSGDRQAEILPPAGAISSDESEEPSIRLNFHNAPLEMMLSYLSEAAGYTIVLEATPRGTIDVWNNSLMTRAEALDVLNTALNKAGLTALVEGSSGNLLRIISRDDARKHNLPIKMGAAPAGIPKTDLMVTQIMPLTHVSASQLVRDLSPLLPPTASITSNEGGNAVIITDTQANIHHFAELAKAIDDSMSSLTGLRVIPLHFADSKTLATVLKELYQSDTSSSRTSGGGGQTGGFGGGPGGFGGDPGGFGGGPGGFGGGGFGGGGGTPGGSASRSTVSAKTLVVAEEHSNSLIVTGPEDQLPGIEALVRKLDENVDDQMEVRLFPLKNADPTEMVSVITSVFPDETASGNSRNGNSGGSQFGSPFGGSPFGGGGPGGNSGGGRSGSGSGSGDTTSERAKKQGKVSAVADARTASVVVTASHDLMRQVETLVQKLDASTKGRQKVYVLELQNADPQTVQQILQNAYPSQQNSTRNSSQSQSTSALVNRANQATQKTGSTTSTGSSRGSGGLGSSGGLGGGGSSGGF